MSLADNLLARAEQTLLTPFSLGTRDLSDVFGTILKHGVDYADIYFQYSRSEAWSLE
ncbi:MAG: TldD protein, partial [Pseudomonadota bacterium]|nr:TldD protein [Pseudomonadota bacterium]